MPSSINCYFEFKFYFTNFELGYQIFIGDEFFFEYLRLLNEIRVLLLSFSSF